MEGNGSFDKEKNVDFKGNALETLLI